MWFSPSCVLFLPNWAQLLVSVLFLFRCDAVAFGSFKSALGAPLVVLVPICDRGRTLRRSFGPFGSVWGHPGPVWSVSHVTQMTGTVGSVRAPFAALGTPCAARGHRGSPETERSASLERHAPAEPTQPLGGLNRRKDQTPFGLDPLFTSFHQFSPVFTSFHQNTPFLFYDPRLRLLRP